MRGKEKETENMRERKGNRGNTGRIGSRDMFSYASQVGANRLIYMICSSVYFLALVTETRRARTKSRTPNTWSRK